MDEETIRREFSHVLRHLGIWDYHPEDSAPIATSEQIWAIVDGFKVKPEYRQRAFDGVKKILIPEGRAPHTYVSRPDLYGLNPIDRTVIIECKPIMPKKEIEPYFNPEQVRDKQRTWLDVWTFQTSGLAFLGLGTLTTPRSLWLIPWEWYSALERRLIKEDLNFKIPVSMLPEEYKLIRSGKDWLLPKEHILYRYADPNCNPAQADWKQKTSLRFEKKEENDNSR